MHHGPMGIWRISMALHWHSLCLLQKRGDVVRTVILTAPDPLYEHQWAGKLGLQRAQVLILLLFKPLFPAIQLRGCDGHDCTNFSNGLLFGVVHPQDEQDENNAVLQVRHDFLRQNSMCMSAILAHHSFYVDLRAICKVLRF